MCFQIVFPFWWSSVKHLVIIHSRSAWALTRTTRMDGQPFPGNVEDIGNQSTADIGVMMGGRYKFARHGGSGLWMADVLPHTAQMADDICLINSMWTDHPNHDNALYKIHSGRLFMGYPTLGAWTIYGLGSENRNLPAYVVLNDPLGQPKNGTRNWTAGFLPPVFQGTRFRPTGSPILNLKPQYEQPSAVTETARGLLNRLDEIHRQHRPYRPELDARMESYSLAAHAVVSHRSSRPVARNRTDSNHVRHRRPLDGFLREALPARSPAGRTRRAFCADLSGRTAVGQSRGSRGQSSRSLPANRSTGGRTAAGPQTTRTAGFDTGGLGRRIRPHADDPKIGQRIQRTRP